MKLSNPSPDHSSAKTWTEDVAQDTSGITRTGYAYIVGALLVFLLWGMFMPLSSAVVANGRVIAAGQNKLLQHPTGGVVRKIHAQDGTELTKGALVIEIDPEDARAELAQLKARHALFSAQKARFEAEKSQQANTEQSQYSPGLRGTIPLPRPKALRTISTAAQTSLPKIDQAEPSAAHTLIAREQQAELDARLARFNSELSSLNNQFEALRSEKSGLGPQIRNQKQLVALQNEELKKVRPLAKERYISKRRLLEIESNVLSAQSRLDALIAQEGATTARMAEIQDRINQLNSSRTEEYSRELATLHSELAAISEQIKAAEKAVSYTQIRAPVDGVLAKLAVHTQGGVIRPGETIGEIVPSKASYLVEARIAPQDVASVEVGHKAELVITAFNRRLTDPFDGRVSYVAADSTIDEQTGEPYFAVRLAFNDVTGFEQAIQSGMFAEAYIQLGARSFFGYLMKPITDSFRKAFQER
ncbi:MAG: HlyD family type I secretion periplasmic adaptor subunit [Cohaesibacter sp.]|jgi:HlyD family type I secretion membrane fusion protein|nr:HlyD family type I secretion periplasmic adaptor subunit [Cohaesibacter sp.]